MRLAMGLLAPPLQAGTGRISPSPSSDGSGGSLDLEPLMRQAAEVFLANSGVPDLEARVLDRLLAHGQEVKLLACVDDASELLQVNARLAC